MGENNEIRTYATYYVLMVLDHLLWSIYRSHRNGIYFFTQLVMVDIWVFISDRDGFWNFDRYPWSVALSNTQNLRNKLVLLYCAFACWSGRSPSNNKILQIKSA